METNLLGSRRSRKPAKGRLPGLEPSEARAGAPPTPAPPGRVTGKAQGRPPPSEQFRAGTCPESTYLDFPDLSSPHSDLPLLDHCPPPPPLSYSLSPFIPAQKQGLQAKCVSWLLGKALSLPRGRHERVRVHAGEWRWGGLVTKGPRPRGAGLGGAETRSLGNDGASLAPRSPVGTEPGATSPKSPALETSHSVTCEPATVRDGVACGIRSIQGACHLRA